MCFEISYEEFDAVSPSEGLEISLYLNIDLLLVADEPERVRSEKIDQIGPESMFFLIINGLTVPEIDSCRLRRCLRRRSEYVGAFGA